jgi:DNA modification methylase
VPVADPTWTLLRADCLDPMVGLASLPDRSVDHVITDPPYAKLVVTSARTGSYRTRNGGVTRELGYLGIDDDQRSAIGMHVARVIRRWAIVFCDAESAHLWKAALEAGGMIHKRMGVWVQPNPTPQFSGDRPGTGFEMCEIAHRDGRCRWNGGGMPAVWIFPRPAIGSEERRSAHHPTPKPIALMSALVADFTNAGDLICDPFAGSGTTGVAALRAGRRFIGWERDERYAEVARRRLEETREQLRLPFERPQGPRVQQQLPILLGETEST